MIEELEFGLTFINLVISLILIVKQIGGVSFDLLFSFLICSPIGYYVGKSLFSKKLKIIFESFLMKGNQKSLSFEK